MSPKPPKGPKPSKPRAAEGAVQAGVAEAVVGRALLRVGEDLVRLVDLLELRLGAGLGVAVGWYSIASWRNARLISSGAADLLTPRVS